MTVLGGAVVGNLGGDPELRYAANGKAIATMNVAMSKSRKTDNGGWTSKTYWVRVTCFGDMAENACSTLYKGDRVVCVGEWEPNEWEDRNTGDKRSALAFIADAIGPDLRFATASITKTERKYGDDNDDYDDRDRGRGRDRDDRDRGRSRDRDDRDRDRGRDRDDRDRGRDDRDRSRDRDRGRDDDRGRERERVSAGAGNGNGSPNYPSDEEPF